MGISSVSTMSIIRCQVILSIEYLQFSTMNICSNVACQNMTPIHGEILAQISVAKTQIVPHAIKLRRGQQLKLSLRTVATDFTYRGFLIQARSSTNQVLGNFIQTEGVKVMECGNSFSTASHSEPSPKSNHLLIWKAPNNFQGYFRFYATVVESFDVFWIDVTSSQLLII